MVRTHVDIQTVFSIKSLTADITSEGELPGKMHFHMFP